MSRAYISPKLMGLSSEHVTRLSARPIPWYCRAYTVNLHSM